MCYICVGYVPSVPANINPPFQYFDISFNQLAGTIPTSIVQCTHLYEFIASHNKFTGTLSAELVSMNLYLLKMDNNLLHGLLPVSIANMAALRTLFLYSNFFHGSLDGVFSMKQVELAVLDLSENNLHGEIPTVLFHLPQLKALSLAKNCFDNHFPSDVCSAKNLEMLDLDGLTAGEGCKNGDFGILS